MKITVFKSNVKNNICIDQGIEIVKNWTKNIFPMEFEVRAISGTFTSKPFDNSASTNNGASQGYMIDPQSIFPVIDTSADVTCLIYDADKYTPRPTNPVQNPIKKGNSTVIQIPEFWYNNFPDVFAMFLLHEITHAVYFLLRKEAEDRVHFQHTDTSFSQKQPYEWYLSLLTTLKPHYEAYKASQSPSTVTITRAKSGKKQTIGKLLANNAGATFTCNTLELPWLNNAKNISCIPAGLYDVRYTFSPRFLKYTYEIQKVPSRSGIRLHSANLYSELNGCIALGNALKDINNDGELDVINSRDTIKAFEGFMGKQDFKLLIK